jgi:hypothetical protein
VPAVDGVFPRELGPDGLGWQWIGHAASIRLAGASPVWVAFRALSLRLSRMLTFRDSAGQQRTVHIGTRPKVYLVGPLTNGIVRLTPTPGGLVASRRDRRPLSIFLSMLRALPRPLAAIPGQGFWPTETEGRVVFNWLSSAGAIDVYAPRTPSGSIWLTFMARSSGRSRLLVVQSGRAIIKVAVSTRRRFVRVGPFQLVRGRAKLLLSASPGPSRYSHDPRLLTVQIAQLGAHTSPSQI